MVYILNLNFADEYFMSLAYSMQGLHGFIPFAHLAPTLSAFNLKNLAHIYEPLVGIKSVSKRSTN